MVGSLGWFWIRLNEQEIRELLEAAYRDDLIEPTGRTERVDGQTLAEPEWKPSTLGRAVTQARSLSLGDARIKLLQLAEPAAKGAETWVKRAGTVLGAFGAVALGLSPLLVVLGVGVLLVYLVAAGLRDDANLREAALAWPRLAICRPGVYERYAVTWRPWPPPLDVVWIVYGLALAGLIGIFGKWKVAGQHSVVTDWHFAAPVVGLPVAIAVAMLSLVYLVLRRDAWRAYRANRRRFGTEVDLVDRLRDEDRSRVADPCIWGQACTAQHKPGEPLATAAAPVIDHDVERREPPWTAGRYAIAAGSAILVATGLVLGAIFISSGIRGTYSDQSATLAASACLVGALACAAVLVATISRR